MDYLRIKPESTEMDAEIYIMDKIQKSLSNGEVTQGIDGTVVTEEDEKTLNKMMKNLIEVIRPKGPSFDTAYNIYNQVKLYKSLTEGR